MKKIPFLRHLIYRARSIIAGAVFFVLAVVLSVQAVAARPGGYSPWRQAGWDRPGTAADSGGGAGFTDDNQKESVPACWAGPITAATYRFTDQYRGERGGALAALAAGCPAPYIDGLDGMAYAGAILDVANERPDQAAGIGLLYRDQLQDWLRFILVGGVKYEHSLSDPRTWFIGLGGAKQF